MFQAVDHSYDASHAIGTDISQSFLSFFWGGGRGKKHSGTQDEQRVLQVDITLPESCPRR
jgi:hypothetical protein